MVQPQFADGLANMTIVRWDQHFQGVLAGILKSRLRVVGVGQEPAEDDDDRHGNSQTDQRW